MFIPLAEVKELENEKWLQKLRKRFNKELRVEFSSDHSKLYAWFDIDNKSLLVSVFCLKTDTYRIFDRRQVKKYVELEKRKV